MSNITISLPDSLKKEMEKLPEVNWSEVTREFLTKKVRRMLLLRKLDKMLEDSKLTEEDCLRLGKEVNKAVRLRIEKELSKAA